MAGIVVFRSFDDANYNNTLKKEIDYEYHSIKHVEVITCNSELLLNFFCNVFYGIGLLLNKYEKNECIIGYEIIPECHFLDNNYIVHPDPELIPKDIVISNLRFYEHHKRIDNFNIRPLYDRLVIDIDRKDIDIKKIKQEAEKFGNVTIGETNKGYHIRIQPNSQTKYHDFLKWKVSLPGVDFKEIAITMRKISLPILFNEKVLLKSNGGVYYRFERECDNNSRLKQIMDKEWYFFDGSTDRMKIISTMNFNCVPILSYMYVYYRISQPESVIIQCGDRFVTNDKQLINLLKSMKL